jgi:hypothetical protein
MMEMIKRILNVKYNTVIRKFNGAEASVVVEQPEVSSRRMENTFMLSVTKVILNIYFMSLWQPIIFPLTVDKIYYYLYQREIHKVFLLVYS